MLHSIKSRLLLIFILFGTSIITAMLFSFSYIEKKQRAMLEMSKKTEKVYQNILKDVKVIRDFFSNETIKSDYFISGRSKNLDTHRKKCRLIKEILTELTKSKTSSGFDLQQNYEIILSQFNIYVAKTDSIVKDINIRGFKDHKLEGRMRYYAHLLEGLTKEVGLANVLLLRKHEKDFIIRQDPQYASKLHEQAAIIKTQLSNTKLNNRGEIIKIINIYESKFDSLVFYDKKIGLKNQEGLKQEIDNLLTKIETNLESTLLTASVKEAEALTGIKYFLIDLWIILFTIGIIASFLLSRRISASITHLKEKMVEFLESDFKKRTVLPIKESEYEIDVLTTNFSILEQHIIDQMRALRDKNRELETFANRATINLSKGVSDLEKALVNANDLPPSDQYQNLSLHVNSAVSNINDHIEELNLILSIKKEEIKTEFIETGDLIRKSIESLKAVNDIGNVIFRTKIEMRNQFYSDARLVKVILKNLISNSVAFRNQKNPFVDIAVEEMENKMVKITVTDNGIGIKKDQLKSIFDTFNTTTEGAKGSGLGLYIVQNALQRLKGAIKVISTENTGTSITVILPNATRKINAAQRIKENKSIFPKREEFLLDYL